MTEIPDEEAGAAPPVADEDERRAARRAGERRSVGFLVAIGLVVTAVCGVVLWNVRWDEAMVTDVLVSSDGIELGVFGIECDADSRARVWQRDESVEIRLTDRSQRDDGDCLTCHLIRLDDPLGARVVIDEPTGRAVPIVPVSDPLSC